MDEEGIATWLEENGEIFGIGQTEQSAQQTVIARDAEQAAAIRQMANASKSTTSTPGMEGVLDGIENADSMEDLMTVLRQA